MKHSMYSHFTFLIIIYIVIFSTGCKKLVTVPPPSTAVTEDNIFKSDATAAAVLTGIYSKLSRPSVNQSSNSLWGSSVLTGLSGDELSLFKSSTNATLVSYYKNTLSSAIAGFEQYNLYYPLIYTCNAAIENLNQTNSLSPQIKQQLLGEAKFLRAFFFFNLTNLYGDIPLPLTSNYTANATLARSKVDFVYDQILKDLNDAIFSLSSFYLKGDAVTPYNSIETERIRPTRWAALALKARVSLYRSSFSNAIMSCTEIINSTSLFSISSIDSTFLKNNKEAIWQLQPVNTGWNTEEARYFSLTNGPTITRPVYLNNGLVSDFEPNDLRKSHWIRFNKKGADTFFFSAKYKALGADVQVTEYMTLFRLSEMYLIRAEAKIRNGNLSEGLEDLNVIRLRAGLPNISLSNADDLLKKLIHERRTELFLEYGHRWFDMKRLGIVDTVMTKVTPLKSNGGKWVPTQKLYPLPIDEIIRNHKILQNEGY